MAFLADDSATFSMPVRSASAGSPDKTSLSRYSISSVYNELCWRRTEAHQDSEEDVARMREYVDRLNVPWRDDPPPRVER